MNLNNKFNGDDKIYKINDFVVVRDDLIVGRHYRSRNGFKEMFAQSMVKNMGKLATISRYTRAGYMLDIDKIFTYTDAMLKPYVEKRSDLSDEDIRMMDRALAVSILDGYKSRIDKALDSNDESEFEQLIEQREKFVRENISSLI